MSMCAACDGWIVPVGANIGYTGKICCCLRPAPAPERASQPMKLQGLPEPQGLPKPASVRRLDPKNGQDYENIPHMLRSLAQRVEAGDFAGLARIVVIVDE